MSDKKKVKKDVENTKVDIKDKEKKTATINKEAKTEPVDPIKEMEAKLETSEQKAKENYDRFLRISAEFENYKKRSARETSEFRKFANESLIKEMLSVVDNLERALDSLRSNKQDDTGLMEGVDMTLKEILNIFEKFSVKPVESLGKPFNPAFHQAVMQEETDDHLENIVTNEMQKGYMMHDRLIRPAMVVVSKSKVKTGDEKK
ncbi:MAG: nucleotide exchange factor GrpE [Deltaproteobacteria bacterium]|nr:nucleotide exchange factor GrpE [Deltaproteobacteria bacterium]MBW2661835.1 nucleotide exchange factor GrpE [Deltaproteobacteria bacterium]